MTSTRPLAALALLLPLAIISACQPCDCALDEPGLDPDDPHVDPDDAPDRDRFRPGRIAIEGTFAYLADTREVVAWTDGDQAQVPTIHLRLTDDRFLGTSDARHRCRTAVVPLTGAASASLRSFSFSFGGGDPERDYAHLMLSLAPGDFELVDAPFEQDDGETVRGCLEIDDDPDRGFSLRFGEGSFARWAGGITWGIGVGDIAPLVAEDAESYPETSYLREMWDFGYIGGGSARMSDDNLDFLAPTGIAFAYELTEERALRYDLGLPAQIPADQFTSLQGEDAAPSAVYDVISFYSVTFR